MHIKVNCNDIYVAHKKFENEFFEHERLMFSSMQNNFHRDSFTSDHYINSCSFFSDLLVLARHVEGTSSPYVLVDINEYKKIERYL